MKAEYIHLVEVAFTSTTFTVKMHAFVRAAWKNNQIYLH